MSKCSRMEAEDGTLRSACRATSAGPDFRNSASEIELIPDSAAREGLLDLAPRMARRVRDGIEREVPLSEVVVGDLLRVKPGDAIPVDGSVKARGLAQLLKAELISE